MYTRINQRRYYDAAWPINRSQGLTCHKELNALQTVGYRELFSYLNGEFSLQFAVEDQNTRRFAATNYLVQRDKTTKWYDFETPYQTIIDYIASTK
jgi:tRNA dimethylallyltransferase